MLTRARRRRMTTVAASALSLVVLVAGGLAGARILAGGDRPGPADTSPAPSPSPSARPTPSPSVVPTPVKDFVNAFLAARIAGSGAEDAFLTEDSAAMYATHQGGLYLYDGDDPDGQPEVNYHSASIDSVSARGDGSYDVVVVIEAGEFEGVTGAFVEELWIGQGLRLDGSRGWVVRQAQRVRAVGGETVKHCFEGSATPVRDCARAFMQTRLDGAGAEFYLTEDARALYDDPSNDLHLYGQPYGDSGGLDFQSWLVQAIAKRADTFLVDVELEACPADGGSCFTIFETLTLGPGRNQNGELQDFIVRSAEISPA